MSRTISEEHKRRIGETRRARKIIPWNKGRKWDAETIAKMKAWHATNQELMRQKLIGHHSTLKGKALSQEQKQKIKANAARPWLGKHLTDEHKRILSEKHKGIKLGPFSDEHKEKISAAHKARWKDPEYARRKYREWGRKPTRPERAIMVLLESLYPGEWKYTGDFTLMIDGRCPDFVNINGQKKIIELFGDYWHRGEDPKDRAAVFAPFGYETLVVWERELKDMAAVAQKIETFAKARK